jgi:hypothetical protein
MGLRLRIGPNAFGNALGSSLAENMRADAEQRAKLAWMDKSIDEVMSDVLTNGERFASTDGGATRGADPLRVEINGVGWRSSGRTLGDGTEISKSTMEKDRLMVGLPTTSVSQVPEISGYAVDSIEKWDFNGTTNFYYSPVTGDPDIAALRSSEMARIIGEINGFSSSSQGNVPVGAVSEQAEIAPKGMAIGDADGATYQSSAIPWYIPQNMFSGAMQSWDSLQRARYTSAIKQASQQAVQAIDNAWVFNDVRRATDSAWQASETRNAVRKATQQRLTWSGYQISKALDKTKDVAEYFANYRRKEADPVELARLVATKAGSSNAWATGFAWAGRIVGPAGIVIGGVKGYNAVQNAPEGEKGYVAAQEVSGQVLGAALGMAGAALAVMALGSNPLGWAVIGASIAGGVAGGLAGDYAGRWGARQIYNLPWQR